MKIIIPMAGAGQRFATQGYSVSKPAILTTDRRTGQNIPMVVCATKDLPGIVEKGGNITYIDRTFHKENGIEDAIKEYFPKANFITISELTEGQACTCLLAKSVINSTESLLIAGCDNGMVIDQQEFSRMTDECDVLAFTYRHNQAVLENPDAYGWLSVENENSSKITGISIKKAISETPMEDHAIVATFWFKHGCDFVRAAEKMIAENDRVNNEFYVDQVLKHCLDLGMDARIFEIKRYIGWGTPKDYEEYQATIQYWKEYTDSTGFLPGK